jgi:hypothetical protein
MYQYGRSIPGSIDVILMLNVNSQSGTPAKECVYYRITACDSLNAIATVLQTSLAEIQTLFADGDIPEKD